MGGLIAGTLSAPYLANGDLKSQAIFVTCTGVGSLLPDIDSIHSKIGRAFLPVSAAMQLVFGHRGIFHTLLFPIVLSLILILCHFFSANIVFLLPLLIGYISHLLLDLFNPEGVPLLWPLNIKFSVPLAETGSFMERIVFVLLVFAEVSLIYPKIKGII